MTYFSLFLGQEPPKRGKKRKADQIVWSEQTLVIDLDFEDKMSDGVSTSSPLHRILLSVDQILLSVAQIVFGKHTIPFPPFATLHADTYYSLGHPLARQST